MDHTHTHETQKRKTTPHRKILDKWIIVSKAKKISKINLKAFIQQKLYALF